MYDEKEIRISFPISTVKCAQKERQDGEKTERGVAYSILRRAAKQACEREDNFLYELRNAAAGLRLIDRSKRVLDLKTSFYRAYAMDAVQFLAAEVTNMEIYGNKDCYAKVSYAGSDKIYQGTVIFSAEEYYRFFDNEKIDESRPIYLIGTCVRKEYKIGARKVWNRYSSQMRTVSEAKVIKKTRMLNFFLGNLPEDMRQ